MGLQMAGTVEFFSLSWLKRSRKFLLLVYFMTLLLTSCSVLEKASSHGFESGNYTMIQTGREQKSVYVETSDEDIKVYRRAGDEVFQVPTMQIPIGVKDSVCHIPVSFRKNSLDIDITTVLFKVRPGVADIPMQLTADFNAALYAGWRFDTYRVKNRRTPLGRCEYGMTNRGFDLGVFCGLGTTPVNSFFTGGKVEREYSAMVMEYGVAAFLESSMASFGLAAGTDLMAGPDRGKWIYRNKPWIGFIIGVALN